MINLKNLIKTVHFTDESIIDIQHNGGTKYAWARLLVDSVDRSDLVKEVKLDPLDPTNKVQVILSSAQTGCIQVLDSSAINAPGIEEYGSFFRHAYSEGISSQTGESYIEKVSLNTGDLPVGSYLINWSYIWNHSSTSSNFKARILLDGEEVMSHEQQPASSGGSYGTTGSDQKIPAYGLFRKVFNTEASHTLKLEFCSSKSGRMSSIWNASLTLRKVPD